jgi:hypothetical protein
VASRSKTATASLMKEAAYTLLPSAETVIEVTPMSATPLTQAPLVKLGAPEVPFSEMQPAVPAFSVSLPLAGSRSKMTTARPEATYTFLPSGETATDEAPPRPTPSAQAPPVPVSEMQPSVPAFWVSLPLDLLRSKIATALSVVEVA